MMAVHPYNLAAEIVDMIFDAGMSCNDEPLALAHALAIMAVECAPEGKRSALIDELAGIAKKDAAKLEGFLVSTAAEAANENVTSIFTGRRK
jgi:hypothetical protein